MNKSVILLSSLLLPAFVVAAPFCAVTGSGSDCGYYDVQSCRLAAGPGGACVANSDQNRRPPVKFLEGGTTTDVIRRNREAAAKQRAEEQEAELRQLEIEQKRRELDRQDLRERRQQMDQRLLGLVSDNEFITKGTEALILSTLLTALDMDQDYSSRKWGPTSLGSSGTVDIQETKSNIVGETCRLFTLTLRGSDQSHGRSVSGIACRRGNKWVWQAPQLQ